MLITIPFTDGRYSIDVRYGSLVDMIDGAHVDLPLTIPLSVGALDITITPNWAYLFGKIAPHQTFTAPEELEFRSTISKHTIYVHRFPIQSYTLPEVMGLWYKVPNFPNIYVSSAKEVWDSSRFKMIELDNREFTIDGLYSIKHGRLINPHISTLMALGNFTGEMLDTGMFDLDDPVMEKNGTWSFVKVAHRIEPQVPVVTNDDYLSRIIASVTKATEDTFERLLGNTKAFHEPISRPAPSEQPFKTDIASSLGIKIIDDENGYYTLGQNNRQYRFPKGSFHVAYRTENNRYSRRKKFEDIFELLQVLKEDIDLDIVDTVIKEMYLKVVKNTSTFSMADLELKFKDDKTGWLIEESYIVDWDATSHFLDADES